MEVVTHKNLILVFHKGNGDAEQGKRITDAMRSAVHDLRRTHQRIGIYHDVSELEAANQDYVNAFGGLAKELGKSGFVYVATIPKAWVRVLAKTAAFIGGIDTHFFKSEGESFACLKAEGFELPMIVLRRVAS
jgi:hypothetical protein